MFLYGWEGNSRLINVCRYFGRCIHSVLTKTKSSTTADDACCCLWRLLLGVVAYPSRDRTPIDAIYTLYTRRDQACDRGHSPSIHSSIDHDCSSSTKATMRYSRGCCLWSLIVGAKQISYRSIYLYSMPTHLCMMINRITINLNNNILGDPFNTTLVVNTNKYTL